MALTPARYDATLHAALRDRLVDGRYQRSLGQNLDVWPDFSRSDFHPGLIDAAAKYGCQHLAHRRL
jgi:hypothetical protein